MGLFFTVFLIQFKEQAEAIIGKDAVIINMSQCLTLMLQELMFLEEVIKNFKIKMWK